jgi:hypothetical protein
MCNAPLLVALVLAFFASVGNAFVPSVALSKAAAQCKASSTVVKRSGAATALRATSTMTMGEVVDLMNREFQVSLVASNILLQMQQPHHASSVTRTCRLRKLIGGADT